MVSHARATSKTAAEHKGSAICRSSRHIDRNMHNIISIDWYVSLKGVVSLFGTLLDVAKQLRQLDMRLIDFQDHSRRKHPKF